MSKRAFAKFAKSGKGPAPIESPENAVEIVRKASERGCLTTQIATALGVSRTTFGLWRERYPELDAAYREGHQVEHDALVGKLFEMAMAGHLTATRFIDLSRIDFDALKAHFDKGRKSIEAQKSGRISVKDILDRLPTT